MGHITVDGTAYEIDHLARGTYTPSYILQIKLSNRNQIDINQHELRRVLNCHSRSTLTDDVIKAELDRFVSKYPDANISTFGVLEEHLARQGDPITTTGGDHQ